MSFSQVSYVVELLFYFYVRRGNNVAKFEEMRYSTATKEIFNFGDSPDGLGSKAIAIANVQ